MTPLKKVIQNPKQALWYFRKKTEGRARRGWWLLRRGDIKRFRAYVRSIVTGKNPYLQRRLAEAQGRYIEVEVAGRNMLIDAYDEGISQDLIKYGSREPLTTEVYRSELRSLASGQQDIIILDIGANIGYYAIQAADIIGENGTVYAIEPAPENVKLLEQNVERNGITNISVHRGAMDAVTGTANLQLSLHSNRHRINSNTLAGSPIHESEHVETPTWRVDDFIAEQSIRPEEVDVVRMDLEGYETEVFKGMVNVLDADSSMIINIELHPGELSERSEIEPVIDALAEGGFEIVSVNAKNVSADIADFDSLKSFPVYWYELIAKR